MADQNDSSGLGLSRRQIGGIGLAMMACATGISTMTGIAPANALATPINPMDLVDPELRAAAAQFMARRFEFNAETLRSFRAGSAATPQFQSATGVPVTQHHIPVGQGAPDVLVYVINAAAGASRPGIVFMHGGGFVLGSAVSTVRDMQDIATALSCVVMTVEYRLAPETAYAGSVEDNYAALKWMHANAESLGVDARRIAVMGESAGGGHAALLAIAARDRGEVPVLFQCLIYPMLDDRTGSTQSPPAHIGAIGWTSSLNRSAWRMFLGAEPGGRRVPAAAVPARVRDVSGLPPAFIGVGALDLFVQEDVEYARRLIEAGVPTELNVVPGAFHGFDMVRSTSIAQRFTAVKIDALRRAFANGA